MNTVISQQDFRVEVMKKIDNILKETKDKTSRIKLIHLKKFFWANQR